MLFFSKEYLFTEYEMDGAYNYGVCIGMYFNDPGVVEFHNNHKRVKEVGLTYIDNMKHKYDKIKH